MAKLSKRQLDDTLSKLAAAHSEAFRLQFLVLAGDLSWWVILIVFLWGLDDSITINWRKLFRRRS